jgi:DNA ligase D-like protein (predicted ligase)
MATTLASSPRPPKPLPAFVEPMLALLTTPFESRNHFFETKWDGFRALAFVEKGELRLVGRRKTDFTPRFPELHAALRKLPAGTVLDGEIIHLTDGRPDFHALLARERSYVSSRQPDAVKLARARPVQFMAFDLLYERGKTIMPLPLHERRVRLDKLLMNRVNKHLAISEGRVGGGIALFNRINKLGLEGVMAKKLDAPYEPGVRSGAWVKFKQRKSMPCVILGYEPSTARGIKSVVVAADVEGTLKFVGQVGSGLGNAMSSQLLRAFRSATIPQPIVPAAGVARTVKWVRPEWMCSVSFAEWTNDGRLRQPVFEGLIDS